MPPSYFVLGNNDADNIPALTRATEGVGGVCLGWGGAVTPAGRRVTDVLAAVLLDAAAGERDPARPDGGGARLRQVRLRGVGRQEPPVRRRRMSRSTGRRERKSKAGRE
jgi:hypothetical protein